MQANRSCSGVPIPLEEVQRREREKRVKRQRAAAAVRERRSSRDEFARKPEPEMNCRSPGTDRDKDRWHCIAADQLQRQHVVPEGRSVPFVVDRDCASQRSPDNYEGHFPMSVPSASVESELNRVDAVIRSRSPDRRCRNSDAVTAPRKRFTVFSIERLLNG